MIDGEINIKLGSIPTDDGDWVEADVFFDTISTIQFYNDEELILQLQPSDLTVLYAAYKEMKQNEIERQRAESDK